MGQQNGQLINCKKCGALFVKTSKRDICEACYKEEVAQTDRIKNFIHESGKAKVTIDEIVKGTGIDKETVEHLFEINRLFGVLDKITIKCTFCGMEFECEQKPSFVCPRCINKFTRKEPGKINASYEEHLEVLKNNVRRTSSIAGIGSHYGFIQNFEL